MGSLFLDKRVILTYKRSHGVSRVVTVLHFYPGGDRMGLKYFSCRNLGWSMVLVMLVGLAGCECSKCRSITSTPATSCANRDGSCWTFSGQAEGRVLATRPLTCPVSRDQVVIYTQDGQAELSCVKCGVAKDSRVCIECRAPKATPSVEGCSL